MCGQPLSPEDIWGVPEEQLPKPCDDRNLFDEQQAISPQARPGGIQDEGSQDGQG
jgi:hypothetical protein